jgi:hypothetical protein
MLRVIMDILSLDHDELIVKEFRRMGLRRRWPITSRDVAPQILAMLGVFVNDKPSFSQAIQETIIANTITLAPVKPRSKEMHESNGFGSL